MVTQDDHEHRNIRPGKFNIHERSHSSPVISCSRQPASPTRKTSIPRKSSLRTYGYRRTNHGNHPKISAGRLGRPDWMGTKIRCRKRYLCPHLYTSKNNTFKNVPTRGILLYYKKQSCIEGNKFLNMSMATIFLSNDSMSGMNPHPRHDDSEQRVLY